MPFPSKKPLDTAPTHAVGTKVFVKDPELAQQYPADIIKIDGDTLTLALYQGKEMKRGATLDKEALVDVPKSGVSFAELIGLPLVGYDSDPAPATKPAPAPVTQPAAVPVQDTGKAMFNDVATFVFPSFTGIARGGATVQMVNGAMCREVLNFDGTGTGIVAVVQSASLISCALDKPYCDRVVGIATTWAQQVASGAMPGISGGQQTIATGTTAGDATDAPASTPKRGRRSNAEIAAAKATEGPAATTPVTQAATAPAVVTEAAVITAMATMAVTLEEEILRKVWAAIGKVAQAELDKIVKS